MTAITLIITLHMTVVLKTTLKRGHINTKNLRVPTHLLLNAFEFCQRKSYLHVHGTLIVSSNAFLLSNICVEVLNETFEILLNWKRSWVF